MVENHQQKVYTIHSIKISPLKLEPLYDRPHTWIKLFQLQEFEQLMRDALPNSLKSLLHTGKNNTIKFANSIIMYVNYKKLQSIVKNSEKTKLFTCNFHKGITISKSVGGDHSIMECWLNSPPCSQYYKQLCGVKSSRAPWASYMSLVTWFLSAFKHYKMSLNL